MKRRQVITWTAPVIMAVTLPAHAVTSEEPMPLPPIVTENIPEDMPEPIFDCELLIEEISRTEMELSKCMNEKLSSAIKTQQPVVDCEAGVEYLTNHLAFLQDSLKNCKAIS